MRGELNEAARLPLFALVVVLAVALVAALFLLDTEPQGHSAQRKGAVAPPPVVTGNSRSLEPARPQRVPVRALRVGRRFLHLYVSLQSTPPDAVDRRGLRSVSSLALARTLLAQPPQSAGGGDARASLGRVQVEPLSSSDVRFHAAIRKGASLLRVRCLVQRDDGRWAITALSAAR